MLQVGVRRDVPSFSGVRAQEEKLCQPVVWITNAAVIPFRLVLPKNELTKQLTKQTAADDLQAEKEQRELSSLHTKHDVN
eukprot:6173106-Pleurochrysis_carterae.AAC.1